MANLLESAAKAKNLQKLLELVKLTQLEDTLKSSDSLTVFAPTDEAFAKSEKDLNSLLEDREKLKRIIAYHIGFGDVRAEDLAQTDEVMTMEGSIIAVDTSEGQIKLNDANVITSDTIADNGVIHIIDRVLIPTFVTIS